MWPLFTPHIYATRLRHIYATRLRHIWQNVMKCWKIEIDLRMLGFVASFKHFTNSYHATMFFVTVLTMNEAAVSTKNAGKPFNRVCDGTVVC